jgi:hypothetical protein
MCFFSWAQQDQSVKVRQIFLIVTPLYTDPRTFTKFWVQRRVFQQSDGIIHGSQHNILSTPSIANKAFASKPNVSRG